MTEAVQRAIDAAERADPNIRIVYTEAIAADTYYLRPQRSSATLFVNLAYAPPGRAS